MVSRVSLRLYHTPAPVMHLLLTCFLQCKKRLAGNKTCLLKINLVFQQFDKIPLTTTSNMAQGKFTPEIVEIAKRFPTKPYKFNYDFKDVILYNLAIGASVEDSDDLR